MELQWYFDFISPYSYLQLKQFERLPSGVKVRYHPILFAGLLNHWGHKGPAEIPAKRVQTYRMCQWLAEHHNIEFKMPPAHPFNPLNALRLCVAMGSQAATVHGIFDHLYQHGDCVDEDEGFARLAEKLGVQNATKLIAAADVKARVRANTEAAASAGIYGVPSFVVDEEIFWGNDTLPMLLDYLADPDYFHRGEMHRLSRLPIAKQRTG